MFKIVFICILFLFSILIGLFPVMENSPHEWIKYKLGFDKKIHYSTHILIGTLFYISAAFLSQIDFNIYNYFFSDNLNITYVKNNPTVKT